MPPQLVAHLKNISPIHNNRTSKTTPTIFYIPTYIGKHSSNKGVSHIFHLNYFRKINAGLSKVKVNEGSENTSKCLSIAGSKRSVAVG